jgi:ABC-type glycerol-3-phosphate transport system permease component
MISERPIALSQEEVQSRAPGSKLPRILTHAALLAMAVLMIFPLVWLVSTSLKHPSKQMLWPRN